MIDVEPLDEIDTFVGRRIFAVREASHLSEERLASLLGLDLRGLRAMESGKAKVFEAHVGGPSWAPQPARQDGFVPLVWESLVGGDGFEPPTLSV